MSKPSLSHKDLTTGPIYRHLLNLAIPASMGMLFNTLYNLTDNWFAGIISDDALVGISISSMVFFLFIGLIAGLQTGTAVTVSSSIGEKKQNQLQPIINNSMCIGLLFSIVIAVLGFAFAKDTITWLSSEQITAQLAWEYIVIMLLGNLAFAMSSVAAGALMALGDTKSNRNALIIGFFANFVLNPLFAFGFDMGVSGLALATVLIKTLSAIYLFSVLCRRLGYKPWFEFHSPTQYLLLKQVLPASTNFSIMIMGGFIVTAFTSQFGDHAIAGYTVGLRLEQVLLLPALGLNSAVIAISGQNFGANKYSRVAETYRKALILGLMVSTIGIPVMLFLSPLMITFFSQHQEIINVGVTYLRIDALVFFGYVSLFISIATLQAIKQPNFPVIMGALRQLILPLIINYFLIIKFDLGVNWLFGSVAIIVVIATLITLIYTRYQLRKLVSTKKHLA